MKKILILDDEKIRHDRFHRHLIHHDVHSVYNTKDAIDFINEFHPEVVFLDHDLDDDFDVHGHENTGLTVAKHIADLSKVQQPRLVFIHTMNIPASTNMSTVLREKTVQYVLAPFTIIDFEKLEPYIENHA